MTKAYNYFMVMLIMLMSSYGLSVFGLTLALEILWTASMPLVHLPNTVCLLSSQGCRKTEAHKEFKKKKKKNHTYVDLISTCCPLLTEVIILN